jgi:NitT/TauT family transport system permease protein
MSQEGMELAMMPAEVPESVAPAPRAKSGRSPITPALRRASVVALPVAALIALAVHAWVPNSAVVQKTQAYPTVLIALLVVGALGAALQPLSASIRSWVREIAPLFAAGTLLLCAWELITIKLGLLPLMYFPPPENVLQTLVDDRKQLFDSTWHSLLLLVLGYALGTVSGLVSGIMIGWSGKVRYWGMPILKIIGPIPATAWIPMALVVFPQSIAAGVFLIALAVWFPVTMLSASGVSNVRASYLDVARTLGAGRGYLIFKVALPAAMPSIFIGLFMGLGSSFLTLLVAESTGVSSGLGWYIDWARNYSDYNKVFAALVIMAVFFSTLMTLLFKLRDRVLVWQKGVIKW